jgi:hypothetical protein
MEIDLHGYHPAEIVFNGVLADILKQAWEMGGVTANCAVPGKRCSRRSGKARNTIPHLAEFWLLQLGLQPVYVLVTSMPWER